MMVTIVMLTWIMVLCCSSTVFVFGLDNGVARTPPMGECRMGVELRRFHSCYVDCEMTTLFVPL
jgi:hypothetical protein